MLDLDLEVIQGAGEAGFRGLAVLVFVPEIVDLLAGRPGQPVADRQDRPALALGLARLALAGGEERHVADLGLDQVMDQHHPENPADVDRLGEMAVNQERHQGHLPAVLGDALPPSVGQPAVAQLELEALRQRQKLEDPGDLLHGIHLRRHGPNTFRSGFSLHSLIRTTLRTASVVVSSLTWPRSARRN